MTECEKPTVIIPYQGACEDDNCRDIFVYLRPETNGVLVESSLLRVIEVNPLYRDNTQLVYLANIPGGFIKKNRIIEDHYRYKMPFARYGGSIFTEKMRERFEGYFDETWDEEKVIGAYDALEALKLTEEELFEIRVPQEEVLNINCQVVKKINDLYVVNYDIPALLHKNNSQTDIAVMLFRSMLSRSDFHAMIDEMDESLVECGVISKIGSFRRAFHYSRGPFEQMLDARGHLYTENGAHIPLEQMQFCSFLRTRGILCSEIEKALDNPIMTFRTETGEIVEECIYVYTQDVSYRQAYEILLSSQSHFVTYLAELSRETT